VPVSGASIGGVEEKAKKKIPAAKTYELARVSPRRAGGMVKVRFSFKTAPVSANPPANRPQPPQKGVPDSLRNATWRWTQKKSVPYCNADFLNRLLHSVSCSAYTAVAV
jgi:hypothetical protein